MTRRALIAALLLVAGCLDKGAPKEVVVQDSPLVSVRIAPRKPSEKPPLLVLMHGIGSDERDLVGLVSRLDPRFAVRSVRGPITLRPGAYAWFEVGMSPDGARAIRADQAESSRAALLRFLDWAVREDGADPERVYVAGFSQGGIMALSLALTAPSKLAGAVSMSGRLLPEVEPHVAPAAEQAGLPVLLVRGTRDTVMPAALDESSRARLATTPIALTSRVFEMGHEITPQSLSFVNEWLAARLDGPRREGR